MPVSSEKAASVQALKNTLWPPNEVERPQVGSAHHAHLLRMYAPGAHPRTGAMCTDDVDVDSHWHFHDMHQLIHAFEGAVVVEDGKRRHLIPRQLAAWIPAGVPHRASLHRVRSGSVFFTKEVIKSPGGRIRAVFVSPLMREMMKEALRWPLHGPDEPLRSLFFETMAALCCEWIGREADLFLPSSDDPRLVRALNYTAQCMDGTLADVCRYAGMSERTLRRHLKAEVGMTWEAYRQRSRLLHAVSLLSETDVSVAEIAAQCGFESPSAFARAFRLIMHETPREYRNRVKNG